MSGLMEFLDTYNSGSESDEECSTKIRKPHTSRHWIKKAEFESAESAKKYVNSLNSWKKTSSYNTSDGFKVIYRCTSGLYRKNECPCRMYLLYHSINFTVSLYESNNEHINHTDGNRGISLSIREVIRELYNDGITKPNGIIAALESRGIEVPDKTKLNNFLARLRVETYGPTTISATDILNWCRVRTDVPDEQDKPFVLSVNVEVDNTKQNLKIVISTKRLLQYVNKSNGVQADTTHKLIWQGFPVLIVGTTDMNQIFHPFAIALCDGETESDFRFIFNSIKESCEKIYDAVWNPEVLLADASDAITDGFKAVFTTPVRRLICYLDVVKNIDVKLRGVKDRDEIKSDIEILHFCLNGETFDKVSKLFIEKWKNSVTDFIEYFQTTWLDANQYWYVGARDNFPSTNNSLKATNAAIKKEHTFRERLPVDKFLDIVENMIVKKWSYERNPENPDYKSFATGSHRSLEIWKEAYLWAKSDIGIIEEKLENTSIFYAPSSQAQFIMTKDVLQSYKNLYLNWTSFDDYKNNYCNIIWKIIVESNSTSSCSCPDFFKKYVCKHSVGILIRLGKEKVPNEAKVLPIGQKRKRGRPAIPKKSRLIE